MKNEQNNETSAQETAASGPGKGKLLKILLCVFVFAAVLSAGTATYLASAVFSEPKQIPVQQLQPQDFKLQQKIIQQLYKEFFRKVPRQTARLKIKSAELPSLLRLVDSGLEMAKMAGKYKGINLRDLEPEISKNEIKIVCSQDTGHAWLFGGVLRFKIIARPVFSNKNLDIALKECHIGKIRIPDEVAKKYLNDVLTEIKASEEFERFCTLIREIRFQPDGDLVITYSPAKLALVLF